MFQEAMLLSQVHRLRQISLVILLPRSCNSFPGHSLPKVALHRQVLQQCLSTVPQRRIVRSCLHHPTRFLVHPAAYPVQTARWSRMAFMWLGMFLPLGALQHPPLAQSLATNAPTSLQPLAVDLSRSSPWPSAATSSATMSKTWIHGEKHRHQRRNTEDGNGSPLDANGSGSCPGSAIKPMQTSSSARPKTLSQPWHESRTALPTMPLPVNIDSASFLENQHIVQHVALTHYYCENTSSAIAHAMPLWHLRSTIGNTAEIMASYYLLFSRIINLAPKVP